LPKVRYGAADDHFASTYGLRMLRGSFFDARDLAGGDRVASSTRLRAALCRRRRCGRPPVPPRSRSADGPSVTIIGVISPLKLDAPGDEVQPVMLAPLRQDPSRFVSLVVHTRGDPKAFAPR
jgi:hypothetical protein